VVEVFDSHIFHTKVIYNETELDGMPFVAPEARGGVSFIIAFSKKAGSEEIVGQSSGMFNWDNAWQRHANLDTSVSGMALQRPANPIGSTGDQRALAVGIW
jgi:hypothetical protein